MSDAEPFCPFCDAPRQDVAENCQPSERAQARREAWLTYHCEACGEQWSAADHARLMADTERDDA